MKLLRSLIAAGALALAFLAPAQAFTYSAEVKTARMTATRDQVADGSLEILDTNGTTVCATFGLSSSGGTVSGSTWTLAFDATTVTASASCTAASARIKNSSGSARITGLTVGTSGSDINLNTTTIGSGANVTLSSAAFTHAP